MRRFRVSSTVWLFCCLGFGAFEIVFTYAVVTVNAAPQGFAPAALPKETVRLDNSQVPSQVLREMDIIKTQLDGYEKHVDRMQSMLTMMFTSLAYSVHCLVWRLSYL